MSRKWIAPVLAIVLAAVTTGAVVKYLNGTRAASVATTVRMGPVVVAKVDIAAGTMVPASALEVRQMPVDVIHPRALRAPQDAVGRAAVSRIFAGEQVLSEMVAPAGPGSGLSYVLPPGMRAVTMPANEVAEVAGFVAPGDHVDVVGTVNAKDINLSKIFLQNVLVLAVSQKADQRPGQQPTVTTSVTVALTPAQVEALTQVDNSGRIRLALRPAGVATKVTTTGETTEAALGAPASSAPVVSLPRASTPSPAPARVAVGSSVSGGQSVDVWRSTDRTTVHF